MDINTIYLRALAIILILFSVPIVMSITFPNLIDDFREKKAIEDGVITKELFVIEDINFEKGKYNEHTVNIETENDFIVLSIKYNKEEVDFERSSKKHNEIEISSYKYKGKNFKEEYTVYLNNESVKKVKKEFYEVTGRELDL